MAFYCEGGKVKRVNAPQFAQMAAYGNDNDGTLGGFVVLQRLVPTA